LLWGHTYSWSVNGGVISGPQNSHIVSVIWDLTGTGTISLHQTSPFGCDSIISRDITIMPTPAPVIFGLENTCQNKVYKYSVPVIAGSTYNWSVIGGSILGPNNGSTVNIRWGKPGTGVLRLTQVSSAGCDSAVTKQITITPTPAPVISGPGISCQNYTAVYTSAAKGISHYWQVSGGRIVGFMNRDTVKVAWDSSGPQWIQLTLSSPLGCDSTIRRNIDVNPNPVLSILGPEIVCENHTTMFQTAQLADMSYIWTMTGGGRFVGNTNPANTNIFWTTAGQYELSLKYRNANGCEGTAKKPVIVVDFPKPLINGNQFGCANTKGNLYEGNTYTLLNKKGNTLRYYWSVSPAVPFSLLNETTIVVDWGAPGIYTIYLRQVNTITGCDDTSKFLVEVDSIVKPMINNGDMAGCAPFTVSMTETSGAQDLRYTWYLESAIIKDQAVITNTFTKIGSNPVKLVVSNKYGCVDSVIVDVRLFPKPKADFLIQSPAPYYSDDTIKFVNKSKGAVYYTWDFGDGQIAYTKDAEHRFVNALEHTVWLYAESEQGCRDSIARSLRIMLKPQIFVPNAFTPGSNDDINPTFKVSTRNVSRFTILIYNRWGQIIYRADQPDFEWDGTYQGKEVMIGVYPYLIHANGYQGERFTLTGEINVIK
jgi:gliding motility-associated-like protein